MLRAHPPRAVRPGVPDLHVRSDGARLHQVHAGLDHVGGAGRHLHLGPDRRALSARAAAKTGGDRSGQERADLPRAHLLLYVLVVGWDSVFPV